MGTITLVSNNNKALSEGSAAGFLLLLILFLSGCATQGYRDPRDPFEDINRITYRFNDVLDKAVVTPVAKGYKWITPAPVDRGVTNFFSNLADVRSSVNNLLQFKVARATSDAARVVYNSTFGLLGFIDVASPMGLEKYGEDFGQTLGYWGLGPGPYIVLPLLGPSNARDAVGLVGDWFLDPVRLIERDRWRYGLVALRLVDKRANLLSASRIMDEAALDPYEFLRDAYLQKRRNDVYDGHPPLEDFDEEFDEGFDDEEFYEEKQE